MSKTRPRHNQKRKARPPQRPQKRVTLHARLRRFMGTAAVLVALIGAVADAEPKVAALFSPHAPTQVTYNVVCDRCTLGAQGERWLHVKAPDPPTRAPKRARSRAGPAR